MRSLSAAAVVAFGLAELATCSSCSTCPVPHTQASAPLAAGTADAPQDVSIIALIAQPERFRDHWVQLVGYLVAEFEGDAIYLDETAFVHNVAKNALALDFEDTSATTPARGTHRYSSCRESSFPEVQAMQASSPVR